MDVASLGGAAAPVAAVLPRVVHAGRQGGEDAVEPLYDGGLASNHLAVTALEAPDAARGADVDIVDPALRECLRAANVVVIVRVAAVDDGIVRR